eukprot:13918490-Alexandrium_andersonii.AAC.1
MSREALGRSSRASRSDTAAQLERTAPTPAIEGKRARARVRLPWSRRHTEYNPEDLDDDGS